MVIAEKLVDTRRVKELWRGEVQWMFFHGFLLGFYGLGEWVGPAT